MTDAVEIALIGSVGTFLNVLLTLLLSRKVGTIDSKVNGINSHLQGKLDRQSAELKDAHIENGKLQERDSQK